MADSIIVGKFVGADALASIGACSSVIYLLFSLFLGLSAGIGIVISQYFGAGDGSTVRKGIACSVYILLAAVFIYFAKNKKSFQQIYFVGGNEEAARLSGIKVEGVYRNVYIISAVLAAAAGILTAMTYSSASYSYGTNADLRVITTVAIGGTSLTHGGYGSVTGTLLGTLFMAMIYNAFVMSGISTYYQDVVTGAFLIAAVLMSEGMNILKKRHS